MTEHDSLVGGIRPTNAPLVCEACGNGERNSLFQCRRIECASWVVYRYLVCKGCGCLSLLNVPEDLKSYYTDGYYSQELPSPQVMRRLRFATRLYFDSPASPIFSRLLDSWRPSSILSLVSTMLSLGKRSPRESSLLDVGSGVGIFVSMMESAGFKSLVGVDKFVQRPVVHSSRARVIEGDLSEIQGEFDYIVMNHSYEHLPHPVSTLRRVKELLKANGVIMVRVPLCDSAAFFNYGCAWYALDPPRHLYLHTRRSMAAASAAAGLTIRSIRHDSNGSQFLKSEDLASTLGLNSKVPPCPPIETCHRALYRLRANHLARVANQAGTGDQAAFFLSRQPEV
jgi:SAM-dependent methyltransferase